MKKREKRRFLRPNRKNVVSLTTKMIIPHYGTDCKSYVEESIEILNREWCCPCCGCRAWIHCSYLRNVIEINPENGLKTTEKITIIRVKCNSKECGKTHALIPDFLCPKKRYKSEEITESIEIYEEKGNIKEVKTTAEESTVRRWIKQYLFKISIIILELEKILIREEEKQVSLLDSAFTGMKRIKIILDKFRNIKNSSKIGFINQKLSSNGLKIFI